MRSTSHPRRSMYIPGRRLLTLLPLIALPVLVCADLGSIALVKLAAEDNAAEAGRAGMSAIQFERTATPQNAELAFQAASSVADLHGQQIDEDTFTIFDDGSVRLTARRTAPTVFFKHLPGLRDLAESEVTTTVTRPNW